MLKKIVLLALVVIMSLSMATSAFATNVTNSSKDTLDKIYALDDKYDIVDFQTVEQQKQRSNDFDITLNFDTIEEFEAFLISLENQPKVKQLPDVTIDSNQISRSYNGSSTGSEWIPFVNAGTGLFCWMNTDVMYTYDYNGSGNPYFVSADGATSYITGVSLSSWTQTSAVQNIINNTIKTKVNGTWFIGVAVEGFNVGATSRDSYSWNTYWK